MILKNVFAIVVEVNVQEIEKLTLDILNFICCDVHQGVCLKLFNCSEEIIRRIGS